MRESEIEDYLVRRVHELGGEIRKVKWIGRRGAPDRLVMMPERRYSLPLNPGVVHVRGAYAVWVELKAPGEKAKPHQAREHDRMRAMGQRVEVVDSIDGVEELLS